MTEYIPTCADGSINTILSKNKKYEKEEGCSISNKELQAFLSNQHKEEFYSNMRLKCKQDHYQQNIKHYL